MIHYKLFLIPGENYRDGSQIFLQYNNMTRFESTVFLSVLQKMAFYDGYPFNYVEIGYSNIQIDLL